MSIEPTVFLVDDDPAVRDAVCMCLEAAGMPVESFDSAEQFLDRHGAARPGCLVLDVRMTGASGLELQQELLNRDMALPVVFITGHGDVSLCAEAMKAGAVDFLEKPFDHEALLTAVREGLRKDFTLRQQNQRRLALSRRFDRLTPREREVLGAVVSGQANKQIAAQLGVSHRTIEIHRSRIMKKVQAKSVAALVCMATLCGMRSEPLN